MRCSPLALALLLPVACAPADFDTYVRRAASTRVAEVMHPVAEQVSVEALQGKGLAGPALGQALTEAVQRASGK